MLSGPVLLLARYFYSFRCDFGGLRLVERVNQVVCFLDTVFWGYFSVKYLLLNF